ncbi:hypothetical protein CTAYLR_004496 [Chrysophaeum taylorii]|uniref:Thioredoxin domain-containing protein n=1 Tax=Chrysophaeum taylorii TaxID=2483200 RepID=A0AAD7XIW5_9STRA|nr:hypothetical protein CTAYLR_004496 [Chrysophaeum taylorii]
MNNMLLLRVAIMLVAPAFGGHSEMFGCRRKDCGVAELTDANWGSALATTPHFVMFYAPWCGHCKSLAPKLKAAGKELEKAGVKVGAVDVEPNPRIQALFPDIRGFPTLKFVKAAKGSSSVDYNGPREQDDIVRWSKEQAAKAGVVLVEPAATKRYDELYSFLGRAALDGLPGLLLIASEREAPEWYNKLHASLVKTGDSPEAETRSLLVEARKKSKNFVAPIDAVIADIDAARTAAPLFAAAYANDEATKHHFNVTSALVVFNKLDRKNLYSSTCVVAQLPKTGDLADWARRALDDPDGVAIPQVPKPPSVLAAEARAAKKRGSVRISGPSELESECYAHANCVLAIGQDVSALAHKFSKNNFKFVSLDSDAPPAVALLAGLPPPALVVVKGGKRPRAARVSGDLDAFAKLLDDVLAGQAKFDAFPDKTLPAWDLPDYDL